MKMQSLQSATEERQQGNVHQSRERCRGRRTKRTYSAHLVRIDDQFDGAVGAADGQETADQDQQGVKGPDGLLSRGPFQVAGAVVHPEEVGEDDGQRGETDGARQRQEEVEDGDGRGENKGNGTEADGAAATRSGQCVLLLSSRSAYSHVAQWVTVLAWRCPVLRRMRTNRYLAATCLWASVVQGRGRGRILRGDTSSH